MSRYDKYDPKVGGFRAPLAADFGYTASKPDFAHADLSDVWAVGLNSSGQVVKGAGASGIVGVLILTRPRAAGDIVDIMTSGEITEFTETDAGAAVTAGTVYTGATATGIVDNTAASGTQIKVGWTVEASRLIVRLGA